MPRRWLDSVARSVWVRRVTGSLRDIELWIILGSIVGLLSGLAGVALTLAIEYASPRLIGGAHGILVNTSLDPGLLWVVPLAALGGLASGLITSFLAPEAEGHGTDYVIDSIHRRKAELRARVAVWKIVASSILISTGGSAGKEGPIAQSGASIGSTVAMIMRLTKVERRLLVLAGVAGGISSVFKAPLGAVIFALEVPYKRDIEAEAVTPIAVSSFTGYLVSTQILGGSTLFNAPTITPEGVYRHLWIFLAIGLFTGLLARLFVRTFYWVADRVSMLKLHRALKPALGGLGAGLIAFLAPGVLGQSYWVVDEILGGTVYPWGLLLALTLAKVLATSLSVGSGGSGGVFGPSIVIGASGSAALAMLLTGDPSLVPMAGLVGMMAFLAAAGKVPLAAIVMAVEMSRGYTMIAPAIAAVAISTLASGGDSIYRSQVDTRVDSPFYLGLELRQILRKVRVRQVMTTNVITVKPSQTLLEVLRLIGKTGHRGFPVVDGEGRVVGMITERDIARYDRTKLDKVRVEEAMTRHLVVATPDETLDDAMTKIIRYTVGRLPVVEDLDTMRLVGIVTPRDILRAYKALEATIE
ncbi:MAG: chloride channel protein [Desulfurococcales archaeon]|nr:chloride channel protein [Desulfurococcales archaeon]